MATDAEAPCWAELPGEALLAVLLAAGTACAAAEEEGDTCRHVAVSVAAAACTCRAWRHASATPALWAAMYAARWGAATLPGGTSWRERYVARHALPRDVLNAACDVLVPLHRAEGLQRLIALEETHPTLCVRRLQSYYRRQRRVLWPAVSRAVRELAVVALARAGQTSAPDARAEAALLLDVACAVALLIAPTTDVAAVRAAVARLGAAAAARLAAAGLDAPGASPVARLNTLNAFLFGRQAEPPTPGQAVPSLLDPATPLPHAGGLGFGGARTRYYAAPNSSLASLLETRGGLPITLSLLHVVVAAAAGVDVRPCGVPRQFMTRTPPGVTPEAWYDVFEEQCLVRSRADMLTRLASWGIVPSDALLAPTPPREVAARMVRNLVGTLGGGADAIDNSAAVPLLSAALALSHGGRDGLTDELRVARLQAAAAAGETRVAQQDFDALTAPTPGLPPVPEHFLAALRDILRDAYRKADALSHPPDEFDSGN